MLPKIILVIIIFFGLTTDVFARGKGNRGAVRNDPTTLGSPVPQTPVYENRIPAPLSSPSQAPTINGPVSQPALRGLKGIGQ